MISSQVNTKERAKPGAAVGAAGGTAAGEEAADSAGGRSLNRQEWLQCLVRIAIMRYVCTKREADVSRAVATMFEQASAIGTNVPLIALVGLEKMFLENASCGDPS